jgi:hypothetical protein
MFNEKVCFAIDNNHDLHTVAKFTRFLDTRRALNDLSGSVIQCIGCWQGELEASYIMDRKDYDRLVEGSGYVDEQHCVMLIPGDTHQPCSLLYDEGEQINIDPLREVATTIGLTSWTYVIETQKYFTTTEQKEYHYD